MNKPVVSEFSKNVIAMRDNPDDRENSGIRLNYSNNYASDTQNTSNPTNGFSANGITIRDIITGNSEDNSVSKLNSDNTGNTTNSNNNGYGMSQTNPMQQNQFMPDYVNNLQNSGYMLQQPGLLDTLANSEYRSPYYNEFETAMNLPSDPIVNPMNAKNPLDDSQSLFGPTITDMNFKNSMLNNLADLDPNKKCDKNNDNVVMEMVMVMVIII